VKMKNKEIIKRIVKIEKEIKKIEKRKEKLILLLDKTWEKIKAMEKNKENDECTCNAETIEECVCGKFRLSEEENEV